jgi:hypothetical protein
VATPKTNVPRAHATEFHPQSFEMETVPSAVEPIGRSPFAPSRAHCYGTACFAMSGMQFTSFNNLPQVAVNYQRGLSAATKIVKKKEF